MKGLLFWILALVVDLVAVERLFADASLTALLAHSAAAGAGFFAVNERDRRTARAGVQCLVVLLLPVFGVLLAVLIESLTATVKREGVAEQFREFVRRTAVHADLGTSASFTADRIREQIDVVPLEETLDGSDFMLKRQALDRLARRCSPRSVILLKKALEDEHPDIRFYASGALSRIEAQVSNLVRDAEHEVKLNPDKAKARLALANHYYDYVYMGLLEESLKKDYRERAELSFEKALELDPYQSEALVRLARVQLESRHYDDARVSLNRALEIDPELTQAWLWRAETHFASGKMAEAADDCRRAIESGNVPEAVESVMAWLAND